MTLGTDRHGVAGKAYSFDGVNDYVVLPNLLHGNVVNREEKTRWSLNCRFTGLFTPYTSCEKSLGGFYLPITTRIVSRVGMNYQTPEGFDE